MSGRPPPRGRVVRGILRVGTFQADGVAEFEATPQAFLTSLVPLLTLPLAGGLVMALRGHVAEALASVLANVVVLLAPPVAAHALAGRWRREGLWLRYAVAYNWCQWAVAIALVVAMLAGSMMIAVGFPETMTASLLVLGLAGYAIVLNWFLARTAMRLSGGQAAMFIVLVWLAALVLIMAPALIGGGAASLAGLPA